MFSQSRLSESRSGSSSRGSSDPAAIGNAHTIAIMSRPRVLVLANCDRPKVRETLDALRRGLDARIEISCQFGANGEPLPSGIEADVALAIGGDGTLISQARRLANSGLDLPIIGVNIGRLGFLAEFDQKSLIEQADVAFGPHPPIHQHLMLELRIDDESTNVVSQGIALNDGVITAGEPFRMIEMAIDIDGSEGPHLNGDGVIIATPLGSTAYNVSAGGPIVHPAVDAMTITPIAAHSLAFRPIVVSGASEIRATVLRANPGTTLVADGQDAWPVKVGQHIVFKRHRMRTRLVVNTKTTYWRILLDKLRWAAPPSYRERGV